MHNKDKDRQINTKPKRISKYIKLICKYIKTPPKYDKSTPPMYKKSKIYSPFGYILPKANSIIVMQ